MQILAFSIPTCSQKTANLLEHTLDFEALNLEVQAAQALHQHCWGPGRKKISQHTLTTSATTDDPNSSHPEALFLQRRHRQCL